MIGSIKQVAGSEKAKRAFWSMVIMVVAYFVITGKAFFPSTPPGY